MKAKGIFISTLLVIDTFLVSYAAGFHSRHVLVINPKLPPVVRKTQDKVVAPAVTPAKNSGDKNAQHVKGTHTAKDDHGSKNVHALKAKGQDAHKVDSHKDASSKTDTAKPKVEKPAAKPVAKKTVKPASKPAAQPDGKPGA